MKISFRINNGMLQPTDQTRKRTNHRPLVAQDGFNKILEQQILRQKGQVKVSGHALKRLVERNITLSEKDLEALDQAMDRVGEKGGRETLMFYKDLAFVANIRNRTLITAMDPQNSDEKIFTNIDSAVIVNELAGPPRGSQNVTE